MAEQRAVDWGYSNYAVTQLKGRGYLRYNDLVKLNADFASVVTAKSVDLNTFNGLMSRWNGFVTDTAFKALMTTVVPGTTGQK